MGFPGRRERPGTVGRVGPQLFELVAEWHVPPRNHSVDRGWIGQEKKKDFQRWRAILGDCFFTWEELYNKLRLNGLFTRIKQNP